MYALHKPMKTLPGYLIKFKFYTEKFFTEENFTGLAETVG